MKADECVLARLKELERFRHYLIDTATTDRVYESVGYNRVVGGIEMLMWILDIEAKDWLKQEGEQHGR